MLGVPLVTSMIAAPIVLATHLSVSTSVSEPPDALRSPPSRAPVALVVTIADLIMMVISIRTRMSIVCESHVRCAGEDQGDKCRRA